MINESHRANRLFQAEGYGIRGIRGELAFDLAVAGFRSGFGFDNLIKRVTVGRSNIHDKTASAMCCCSKRTSGRSVNGDVADR